MGVALDPGRTGADDETRLAVRLEVEQAIRDVDACLLEPRGPLDVLTLTALCRKCSNVANESNG
jgi:hypothetical protein